jgi:hypothetical protein
MQTWRQFRSVKKKQARGQSLPAPPLESVLKIAF